MADPIRRFFDSQISPDAPPIYVDRADDERRRLELAACALLLELAHADDEFSDSERAHLAEVIRAQFGLNQEGAQELIALAESERSQATGFYQFTSLIRERFDRIDKAHLVDMLWGLALSDGEIAQHESYLMSKFAGLLDMPAEELAAARKRVEGKGRVVPPS